LIFQKSPQPFVFFVDMPSAFLAKPFSKEISKWLDMNSGEADSAGAGFTGAWGRIRVQLKTKGQRKEVTS